MDNYNDRNNDGTPLRSGTLSAHILQIINERNSVLGKDYALCVCERERDCVTCV